MKVFISHSSKNKKEAARLCDDLAGKRIKTWLDRDELRGGDPLIDELQEALTSSTHLILLWSKPASESRYVSAEWQAERLFHAALGIEPDDASAKNGLGNVYWLRGDLDAAEFFVTQAMEKARRSGFRYEAAESDLEGIREEKASRAAGRRR